MEQKIKSTEIAGENHKLLIYADDIIIYLSEPEWSIEELMKVTEEFGAISGYTLNVTKSEVMVMGYAIGNAMKCVTKN